MIHNMRLAWCTTRTNSRWSNSNFCSSSQSWLNLRCWVDNDWRHSLLWGCRNYGTTVCMWYRSWCMSYNSNLWSSCMMMMVMMPRVCGWGRNRCHWNRCSWKCCSILMDMFINDRGRMGCSWCNMCYGSSL